MKNIISVALIIAATAFGNVFAQNPVPAKGLAVTGSDKHFKTVAFTRHAVGDHDVLVEILYAGICHSDIHRWESSLNEKETLLPGHEIVGRVTQIGKDVTKFKVGDYAGIEKEKGSHLD